jgi:hypothetical protein
MSAWFATVTFIGILVFTSQAALAGPPGPEKNFCVLLRLVMSGSEMPRRRQRERSAGRVECFATTKRFHLRPDNKAYSSDDSYVRPVSR